jgi:hypothetical protein
MPELKIKTVKRADGFYVKYPDTEWMGPWNTMHDALKYSHMVFCADCAFCRN